MKIEVFTLCEAAEDQDGRLSLFGTYERISVPHLPFQLAVGTIALRLRFTFMETGIHSLCLRCVGPDGDSVMEPVGCSFDITSFPDTDSAACNLILPLPILTLQEAGEHSFDFYRENDLLAQLPLLVAGPAP